MSTTSGCFVWLQSDACTTPWSFLARRLRSHHVSTVRLHVQVCTQPGITISLQARSAGHHHTRTPSPTPPLCPSAIDVPWYRLTIYEGCSFIFAVATWNSLPDSLSLTVFYPESPFLFSCYKHAGCNAGCQALYKPTHYLLIFLWLPESRKAPFKKLWSFKMSWARYTDKTYQTIHCCQDKIS